MYEKPTLERLGKVRELTLAFWRHESVPVTAQIRFTGIPRPGFFFRGIAPPDASSVPTRSRLRVGGLLWFAVRRLVIFHR